VRLKEFVIYFVINSSDRNYSQRFTDLLAKAATHDRQDQSDHHSFMLQDVRVEPFPLIVLDNFLRQDVYERAKAYLDLSMAHQVEWEGSLDTIGSRTAEYSTFGAMSSNFILSTNIFL
jgi:hypothetical protein